MSLLPNRENHTKHVHFQPYTLPGAQPSIPSRLWDHLCCPSAPVGGPCGYCFQGLGRFGKHVLFERVWENLGPPHPEKHTKNTVLLPKLAHAAFLTGLALPEGPPRVQCLDPREPRLPATALLILVGQATQEALPTPCPLLVPSQVLGL